MAIVLIVLGGFVAAVVNAQEQLFPVEGLVVDEMGAAIPHAELVFKAESGTIVAQTGVDGVVRVMLGTGNYAVTIVQCGFKTTKLADFFVQGPTVGAFRVVLQVEPRATECGAGPVPTVMEVQTVISELPNVIADAHAYTSVPMAQPATTKHRSKHCLYLWRCSTAQR
jgi:hypothetical protein